MSGYIGNIPTPQATQSRQSFTATAGQTTFATVGYTAGFLDVYLNGVHLLDGTDYTATNGSDIVLTTGAALNDVVEFVAYSTYEVNSQNYTGGLTVDNDGATVLTVDRATSDGTIIDLQKDGATVGSIGVNSGTRIYIGSGDANLTFNPVGNYVFPSTATGGARDAQLDLGLSAARFKDLYLSGGVYLGGTGAANKLDDYEEGTWTPDLGSGVPSSAEAGYYTKVGNTVFIEGTITVGTTTSSSTMYVTNLPFTSSSNTRGGLFVRYTDVGSVLGGLYVNGTSTNFRIFTFSGNSVAYSAYSTKRLDFVGHYTVP